MLRGDTHVVLGVGESQVVASGECSIIMQSEGVMGYWMKGSLRTLRTSIHKGFLNILNRPKDCRVRPFAENTWSEKQGLISKPKVSASSEREVAYLLEPLDHMYISGGLGYLFDPSGHSDTKVAWILTTLTWALQVSSSYGCLKYLSSTDLGISCTWQNMRFCNYIQVPCKGNIYEDISAIHRKVCCKKTKYNHRKIYYFWFYP